MKTVMITDDMMYMRLRLRKIMEGIGFLVIGEAENGEVAVKQYQELWPDLVLLDITMPEMNGLEALQAILQINPKANVVVVSGIGQKDYVQRAILAGAKNYIIKPFDDDNLRKVLKAYL